MTLAALTDPFLDTIITQLRATVPTLAGRVAGAAEFKILPEAATLAVPCAFVIPLDDDAEPLSQNGGRHRVTDGFGVIVAISNKADERGQTSASAIYGIRRELWRSLVGFRPSNDYDGIHYDGRALLHLDRARSWWQFEFSTKTEIGAADAWQDIYQNALPALTTVHINVDDIDPAADANVQYPGPDGRIEFQVVADLPQP